MMGINTFLIILLFIILAIYAYFYFSRNSRLFKKIQDINKKVDHAYELFEDHFKTTDATILDLRKERDELKEELKKLQK